jgi:AcrR family transcriptional regulator
VSPKSPTATADRRAALLDAAYATFLRFGFRKTSMDDIARDAEISRQALYAYFSDKEALFREAMQAGLETALADVAAALDGDAPIGERLVRALDQWTGRHVERMGSDPTDLGEAGKAILGTMFPDYGAAFEKKLARAVAESPLAALCKSTRTTPLQLAQTLHSCARGWKYKVTSRAEFVAHMDVAVRLLVPKIPKG